MNIITLLHSLRDAVADDVDTKAWCQLNYSRDHNVYVGIDTRNEPVETDYPMVHIFPINKASGYDLTTQNHGIGVTCGVNNTGSAATGKDNATELTGIEHIDDFRELIETAITGASAWPVRVETINIEYETVEFFPFFLATMEIRFGHDYSQGDDPFA